MTIFCIWQPDFLSVFVGFEQGNSQRLVGLYALCSTSSGNLIIIHLNFKCFTILSCQSRILSWRKSYGLPYYRLQILNFMVPRNNFFCCTSKRFSQDVITDGSLDWQISIARCATKNLPSDMSSWCVFSSTFTHTDGRFATKFSPTLAFYKISNHLSATSIWMHLPCYLYLFILPEIEMLA